MLERLRINVRFGQHAVVSIGFWLLAWAGWKWNRIKRGQYCPSWLEGEAFNALLLIPLARGRNWAKWLLVAEEVRSVARWRIRDVGGL